MTLARWFTNSQLIPSFYSVSSLRKFSGLLFRFFLIRSLLQRRPKKTMASKMFENLVRLPRFAVPRRYDLELRPDLDTCKFGGKLAVTLNVLEDTKYLVLNAADLVIADSSVRFRSTASRKVVNPSNVSIDAKDEILVLEFDETLPREEGILDIEFQGTLNDQMKGFYRSTYVINGEKRNMAVTQFEPADARKCFPCWDEPSYKATFQITVYAPVDRVVLSNMPVFEEKTDGNLKRVSFQESCIMSTYLVAIVVGEFEYIERTTTAGTKVRVYCQVGKTNQGMFALDVAVRTLPYYAEYFGTPYPLPKLDMVAIPDFYSGAMENYGLVTYREIALLYDEKDSAATNKQKVVTFVTHELAHQWFGNLVTMEWWTHLWLNEGFATWVSYLAADYLFPEWKIWAQFNEEKMDAFRLDALVESHPIEVEVGHPRELTEIFDAISYKKGASIIRMLESYIGAQVFKKGLNSYIKRYAWKNAKTEDLWAVLSEESREPVNELMDSWTKKRGYPVIFAKLEGTKLELEQSQYLSSGKFGEGLWVTPITLCYGSYNARKNVLLREILGSINLSEITHSKKDSIGPSDRSDQYSTMELKDADSQPNWIKLNVEQTAFYRVQYDDELAKRLRSAIAAGFLDAPDRFGILDDMYALCSACKHPLSALLSLMGVYHREIDYSVLSCLIDIAYKVSRVVSDAIPQSAADFKSFTINLLHFAAENLGWEPIPGESHLNAMLRGQILELLAQFGHEKAKVDFIRRFNAFLNDRSTVLLPADIRKAAYIAVMQNATNSDKSGYDSLLRIFRETDLSQEKVRILSSIASSSDSSIVREALDFSLSSEVRNQDALFVYRGISREARETAWLWFKENWEFIWKNWGSGTMTANFITAVTSPFSSEKKADEIQEFFSTRLQPSIERTVNQSIEQVRIRAQWVKHVQQQNGLVELLKELARRKH